MLVLYSRFRRPLQHLGTCVFYVHAYIFSCFQNEKYAVLIHLLCSVCFKLFSLNKKQRMWHFQSINLACCELSAAHSSYSKFLRPTCAPGQNLDLWGYLGEWKDEQSTGLELGFSSGSSALWCHLWDLGGSCLWCSRLHGSAPWWSWAETHSLFPSIPYLPLCIPAKVEMIIICVWHDWQFFKAGNTLVPLIHFYKKVKLSQIFC